MTDVLSEILAHKRNEVQAALAQTSLAELRGRPLYAAAPRDFFAAVSAAPGPNVIAEIKRASPSAGVIARDFDPVSIARAYEQAGATALSVLTDARYFGGHTDFVGPIKAAVGLPVLRKDFIIDSYQVYETRAIGADAVLLIAEALEPPHLLNLLELAHGIGLSVLVEVHEEAQLAGVLAVLGPTVRPGLLLGINNRDLKRQRIDLTTTERLAPRVPAGWSIVAESGIKTCADVQRLRTAGARGLLIGETLMRSGDPRATLRELLAGP